MNLPRLSLPLPRLGGRPVTRHPRAAVPTTALHGSPGDRTNAAGGGRGAGTPEARGAAAAGVPDPRLPETARCEAALLDDLLTLLSCMRRPIDDLPPRPQSAAALGAALAELERAERDGWLAATAVARRRRLLALSGAAARLGTLLHQRRAGLLPDDGALAARRAAILDRLAEFFAV